MTLQEWLTLIAALTAALVSVINAWRGRDTPMRVSDLANCVDELADKVTGVSGSVQALRATQAALPGAAAGAPSASITRVFALWGLLGKVMDSISTVKTLPAGQPTTLAMVRTRIDGRMARFGPVPFEWEE